MVAEAEQVAETAPLTAADREQLRHLAPYRWPLPWRQITLQALALWLATRLLDVALTILFTRGTPTQRLYSWYVFDAKFYITGAESFYPPQSPPHAAYFPLYSLLIWLPANHDRVSWMTWFLSALVIANLGALLALVAVGLLAAHERRQLEAAWQPMLLLAVSPLGVFLAAPYPDGLFVALCAWALLAARRNHWRWASLALALAVVTRPFGIALALALLVAYGERQGWFWRIHSRTWVRPTGKTLHILALLLGAPALTFGAYLATLWRQYGDPLMFLHVEGASSPGVFRWGHGYRWPWQTLALAWHELMTLPHWSWPTAHLLIDLLPMALCLGVLALTMRSAPLAFTTLTSVVVLICLTSPLVMPNFPDPLASDGRYCYAAVPVLLQCGAWMERWPRWWLTPAFVASLALQALLTLFVLHGGWLV